MQFIKLRYGVGWYCNVKNNGQGMQGMYRTIRRQILLTNEVKQKMMQDFEYKTY